MPELRLGSSMCDCGECGLRFSRTSTFDKHRVGRHEPLERRCLTPDEMRAKGMVERNGVWGNKAPEGGLRHWAEAEEVAEAA
jgi:hypothetical protein